MNVKEIEIFGEDFLRDELAFKTALLEKHSLIAHEYDFLKNLFYLSLGVGVRYIRHEDTIRSFVDVFPPQSDFALGARWDYRSFMGKAAYDPEVVARIFLVDEDHPSILFYKLYYNRAIQYWDRWVCGDDSFNAYDPSTYS